ncbi:hypothetical protein Q3W71_16605 [Micromonospora sp. C28SCA-DRY-2]|uniref:hypothetical protein n=1 Tax=Micromonospora sp. C28SCA-DRY-2 TaxID=3059522 RepID=UPI002675003A|nr:hypothetical protein [Micromonospora sp. C28SCA-DRY-2]MDO3703295.1 hypothetical protein [Micromonospora sp. C28SCA-DRY-2]
MSDWEQFLDEVSWFLRPGESAAVGEARPWARGSIDGLPELSALLASATVTPVSVGGTDFELLAWGSSGHRRGWLCQPPREQEGDYVARTHMSFWKACGGIVERFSEPTTWWTNQDEVLTVGAAHVRIADALNDYAWLWEDTGLELPIDPDEYYAVAVEANGNLTLAHRNDGHLLLFAPDHDFAGVTPVVGFPPYSLLTIDGVPDLATWMEACAAVWRYQ